MVLDINFTKEEKIKFLDSLGYKFTIIESHFWEQQGNHDSNGKWRTEYVDCAIKHNGVADKSDSIDLIFKKEIQNQLKKILLNSKLETPSKTITVEWDNIF